MNRRLVISSEEYGCDLDETYSHANPYVSRLLEIFGKEGYLSLTQDHHGSEFMYSFLIHLARKRKLTIAYSDAMAEQSTYTVHIVNQFYETFDNNMEYFTHEPEEKFLFDFGKWNKQELIDFFPDKDHEYIVLFHHDLGMNRMLRHVADGFRLNLKFIGIHVR